MNKGAGKGQTARAVSVDILNEILNNKAYGGIALNAALNSRKDLDARERAFITELTNGVVRNLTLIDYIIAQFSKTPAHKMKPLVLNVIRQGVYQLVIMEAAGYAACSEAVDIVKARGLSGLSGFVNGVLRNISRSKDSIKLPDEKREPLKYLSVVYSHPEWLVKMWLGSYDYAFVKSLLDTNNTPPSVTVCPNTLRVSADKLADILIGDGVSAEKSGIYGEGLVALGTGGIGRLKAYREGMFHVQDIASQIAVAALNPKKGQTVVDLCAAPGGKSFLSAYMMENCGTIYARDIHSHKIKLIDDGASRLGLTVIKSEIHDAEIFDERLQGAADCVIVDAPCTGLGIIRKKPDIKLNRKEEDIAALQKTQRSILKNAASYVKKGGVLLYSTCTLTKEENEDNVKWFLDNFDFAPDDFSGLLGGGVGDGVKDGCLTLFPHIHGTDGFFISKFRKG